jgi:hypothetical protein
VLVVVITFLAVVTISSREIDSDLFMGGGSTVNVEHSKASNTLTARTEP